jgi:hypothetical protein
MTEGLKLFNAIAAKDAAYQERDRLVAALSKIFPAFLERHSEEDKTWDDDWRWIVFILLPSGQVSWHIHDSELGMFDHVPRLVGHKWDGHTTPEKYERLAKLPCDLIEVWKEIKRKAREQVLDIVNDELGDWGGPERQVMSNRAKEIFRRTVELNAE